MSRVRRFAPLIATGLVVAVLAFMYDPRNLFDASGQAAEPAVLDTEPIRIVSLGEDFSAEGTLVFSDDTVVYSGSHSGPTGDAAVLTELIVEGATFENGDVLWRLGFEPTVVLFGDLPSYRDLSRDDEGSDVFQLETNLVLLGFDPDATVTVDEVFTSNTAAMVRRWQEAIGADASGEVRAASVAYVAGPGRVGDVGVSVGESLGDDVAVMTLTGPDREVDFTILPAERETLAVGDVVEVVLPDRSRLVAMVSQHVIDGTGGATVTATTTDQIVSGADAVPVTVEWRVVIAVDVVTAPAGALLRTDTGQYYVEVSDGTETARFVEVAVGRSADGRVEISGDIAEGDLVISP